MAAWAPSAERVSMTTEISMKNATTPAVRKSPCTKAASTAIATSSFIRNSPRRKSRQAVRRMGSIKMMAPMAALTSPTGEFSG